jgi:hypothetical protein
MAGSKDVEAASAGEAAVGTWIIGVPGVGLIPTLTLVANSGALIGEVDRPFPGVNKRRKEEPNVVTPR